MSVPAISVCMIAQDEAERIGRALESVQWAGEIVVVDGGSRDDTVKIAESLGARVELHPWPNDFGLQVSRAIQASRGEWVFRLDADEVVTPELARQLQTIPRGAGDAVAYRVRRRNYFLGKWIRHGGWWPDPQLRMFRREGATAEGCVHESVRVSGRVEDLEGALEHDTHPSVEAALDRAQRYSTLLAPDRARRKKIRPVHLFSHPFAALFRKYFVQSGWRDGPHGFLIAAIHAMVKFSVYAKAWELQRKETSR